MATQAAFINGMLDDAFSGTVTMHLYKTGLPSTTGVELTGGSYNSQTLTLGSAANKQIATASNAVFTDLSTSETIVAWGVKVDGTLADEGTLTTPFTATIDNNSLELSYTFDGS